MEKPENSNVFYLAIRLFALDFYEMIVDEAEGK